MAPSLPADSGPRDSLSRRIATTIRAIPRGTVATYGQIAALAGNPRFHRGTEETNRGDEQRALLLDEEVAVDSAGRIDLDGYLWNGG